MKKVIVIIICILVVIGAIFTGVMIYDKNNKGKEEEQNKAIINQTNVAEKVEDECVEEEKQLENQIDLLQANANETKISPNCSYTLRRHYKQCGHTTQEYLEIPEKLINKTQKELEELYENWEVEKFSSNEVILYQESSGECGQHYILKEVNGVIVIYQITETGEEKEYQKTEIATDYLTDTDKIAIKNGLKVEGKEALNQIIEDFE